MLVSSFVELFKQPQTLLIALALLLRKLQEVAKIDAQVCQERHRLQIIVAAVAFLDEI